MFSSTEGQGQTPNAIKPEKPIVLTFICSGYYVPYVDEQYATDRNC